MTSPPDAATCPAATGPIPQIIHQSWRTHELPSTLRPLSASWTQLSGWQHRLWTDDENRALWAAHFPELLDVYDGYARPVQRADATRLLYMHVHGGVYADLDVAPCRGLPSIVLNGSLELLLVREPGKSPRGDARRYLTNFWMASAPGHPFWLHAISLLRARAKHENVMSATGPYFLNAAWNKYQAALRAKHAGCVARAAARARVLTFREWQRGVGAHPALFNTPREGVARSLLCVIAHDVRSFHHGQARTTGRRRGTTARPRVTRSSRFVLGLG